MSSVTAQQPEAESVEDATVSTTTHLPKNVRPDAKAQRYDRQLRLWAASGQTALEHANLLVINASATASQTLKNLVLPGIGHYTLLDPSTSSSPRTVDASDIGNNFFLESESLGKVRAEEVVKLLSELNDEVDGKGTSADLQSILSDPTYLRPYSIAIAVDLDPSFTLSLSDICWEANVPLIIVRSIGFTGYIRTQVREIGFVETHPPNTIDMRLDSPFPELLSYAQSFDYDKLDSHDFAHIPPAIIFIRAWQEWKDSHNGNPPNASSAKSNKEKDEFKAFLGCKARVQDAENFDEAVSWAFKPMGRTELKDEIKRLFDDPECENASASSSNFWLLLRSVRNFVNLSASSGGGGGFLPLTGSLPDMKASSATYVTLQNIYRTKAKQDVEAVRRELVGLFQGFGIDGETEVQKRFRDGEVETFVKHAGYLKLVRGRKLRDEIENPDLEALAMASYLPESNFPWYLAIRSSIDFYYDHQRWPGTLSHEEDPDGDKDVEALNGKALSLLKAWGMDDELSEDAENALGEIARAGASDLPQVAALLGGMVAQETIKLVTRQYMPVNGTVIYDGIKSVIGGLNV